MQETQIPLKDERQAPTVAVQTNTAPTSPLSHQAVGSSNPKKPWGLFLGLLALSIVLSSITAALTMNDLKSSFEGTDFAPESLEDNGILLRYPDEEDGDWFEIDDFSRQTNNAVQDSTTNDRSLTTQPSSRANTDQDASTDLSDSKWQPFVSSVIDSDFLPLTKENSFKPDPITAWPNPAVLAEGRYANRVYSDFGQAVITIPKGWYGVDGDGGTGTFYDREHQLIMRIGLTDFRQSSTTATQLKQNLENDLTTSQLLETTPGSSMDIISSDQLLIDLTGDEAGAVFVHYTVSADHPRQALRISLSSAPTTSLTKREIRQLLDQIITSRQIIGMDPTKPNERVEFLDQHGLGAWRQ